MTGVRDHLARVPEDRAHVGQVLREIFTTLSQAERSEGMTVGFESFTPEESATWARGRKAIEVLWRKELQKSPEERESEIEQEAKREGFGKTHFSFSLPFDSALDELEEESGMAELRRRKLRKVPGREWAVQIRGGYPSFDEFLAARYPDTSRMEVHEARTMLRQVRDILNTPPLSITIWDTRSPEQVQRAAERAARERDAVTRGILGLHIFPADEESGRGPHEPVGDEK